MRSYYKYFIVVPLLILIWGCGPSGSIRLDSAADGDGTGSGSIADIVKVSGTRATIQFNVSKDILVTSGNVKCMDKIYGDELKDAAAFSCSPEVSLTPGTKQTVTLTKLLPNKSYLARIYSLPVSASIAKADSSEELLSSVFEVTTFLNEVFSETWRLSTGFSCDTGDVNGDGLTDILCGGTMDTDPLAQVGLMLGQSGIPAEGFPIVKFSADPVNGAMPGWCNLIEDINGDGKDDLIVSDYKLNVGASEDGAVYVFYGPLSVSAGDTIFLTSAEKLTNTNGMKYFGQSCAYMKNLDFLLIGWPGYSFGGGNCHNTADCGAIALYQWDGHEMVEQIAFGSPVLKNYGETNARLGKQLSIGDYDGDGLADLHYLFTRNGGGATGCHDTKLILSSAGYGGSSGEYLHTATLCLPGDGGGFLMTGSNNIDVNQDGYDDFIVYEEIVDPINYKITIYYGGTTVDPARSTVFTGTDQIRFGVTVGDINYDTLPELLIGGTIDLAIYGISGGAIGDLLDNVVMRTGSNAFLEDLNDDGYPEFINVGVDFAGNAYFAISY